ncbi:hypothetical protein CSW29_02770 [Thermus scotoductus]|uniref:Uncharacterized protein n=1 Tax=Thermus scotoductus TaxID=37636 RepID=A0A430UIS9_THESC|nr:hypothetical protein CSW29_02770 [Thermus scotoductus]
MRVKKRCLDALNRAAQVFDAFLPFGGAPLVTQELFHLVRALRTPHHQHRARLGIGQDEVIHFLAFNGTGVGDKAPVQFGFLFGGALLLKRLLLLERLHLTAFVKGSAVFFEYLGVQKCRGRVGLQECSVVVKVNADVVAIGL